MRVNFDIPRLIEALGGAEGVLFKLKSAGIRSVSRRGVHKWGQRNAMPSARLAELLTACALDGDPIDLHKYITSDPRTPE